MSHTRTGAAVAELRVPAMDCPSCAGKIERALEGVSGVSSYDTRPTTGTVTVEYDPTNRMIPAISDAIERSGYEVTGYTTVGDDEQAAAANAASAAESDVARNSVWTSERAFKTWISAMFALVGLVIAFLLPGSNPEVAIVLTRSLILADILFLAAVATAGETILRNGYHSLRHRSLDIDLLMSIAIIGALVASFGFGAGLYLEAALLAVLFSVAELLERYSIDKARRSLRELMDLSPAVATVRHDGETHTLPVEAIEPGDIAVVRPGEKIPMDGIVIEGESAVNQSPITGESVPVDKMIGDEVYAGTINESGYLEVRITAEASDSTLSRIIELVENAQAATTDREQFVNRFASYYTPIVVVLAVTTAILPPLLIDEAWTVDFVAGVSYTFPGAWEIWFLYGLTLLVLACPCAFVISTPVSVVSGITSGAKQGVLIKGGTHLEAMGEVNAVALDKTGTLTKGELTVTDVIPLNGYSEADVLRCARGLEARSEHPIGEAIVEHATDRRVDQPTVTSFESITGKGVEATVHDTTHYAGKPGLFAELGFDLTHVHAATDGGAVTTKSRALCERHDCLDLLEETIPALQAEGKTVVLIGSEVELEGVIAVADEIRSEARTAIAQLREQGVEHITMLTGDNGRTAGAIAAEVGVDDYRAELLPAEKVAAVEDLAVTYDGVAMVGDGVNDAPALATATVGIAMGAAGTDTALETADIALMGDDLSRLPYLYALSHTGNRVIRQNIWSSLAAKGMLAIGVPFGLVPVWAAVLIGDAGMTVGVTGNAMRLSRIAPVEADASSEPD